MLLPTQKDWHFNSTSELFHAAADAERSAHPISIVRMAPSDGKVELEWLCEDMERSAATIVLQYRVRDEAGEINSIEMDMHQRTFVLHGLHNGLDYELWLDLRDSSNRRLAQSATRLVRTGSVPGIVVNYIHPEDLTYGFSGHSTGSPSLTSLPDGTIVASHAVFWGGGGQNLTLLFASRDRGETWSFLTYLYPCFWGKLFVHREQLYMLGQATEYGALLIGRSEDGGRTWSPPSELLAGGNKEKGGPHKAPLPVIEHGGRVWSAIDYGSWSSGGHASMVISAAATADLLDPKAWTCTPPLSYNKDWPGTVSGGELPGLLEGNVVPAPDGGLVNLLRYHTKGAAPDYGKAILLHIDQEHPEKPLTFDRVIDFHGNMSKFSVYYDAVSQHYWSLVNRVTGENVDQRNVVTLVTSPNLTDWTIVRDVLDYEHNGWPEDSTKAAFQYWDWIVDGEDLLAFSRTSLNGAYNFHNANHVTLHRITSFRTLPAAADKLADKPWHAHTRNALLDAADAALPRHGLHVTRLVPGDGSIRLDWQWEQEPVVSAGELGEVQVRYRLRGEQGWRHWPGGAEQTVTIHGLMNGHDYEVQLFAKEEATEPYATSPIRLAKPGAVPGTVVQYLHPEDECYGFSGRSPASPSIARLPDGRLVASHDLFWHDCGQNTTMLYHSHDNGESWTFITYLYPCFWGKLFVHRGLLYMLGCRHEYGALLIGRSLDGGQTWSAPTELLPGGSSKTGGPHRAPMPVLRDGGRLWTAVEHGSWSLGGHGAGLLSVPEDADLLEASNWTVTPFQSYDPSWPGTIEGGHPGYLEGNIVRTPSGELVNVLRYNTTGGQPDYGKAIIMRVDRMRPERALTFDRVIDFHGNNSKFVIQYDPISRRYWSLVNRVTLPNVTQRNILSLVSSADLEHWHLHCDVLDFQHNDWPEDDGYVAFQYADWLIEGEDLLALSRTAINGAYNFHNANFITCHRIRDFRKS